MSYMLINVRPIVKQIVKMKYYDIGFNLTDPMFQGVYHGRKSHNSDITNILQRAHQRNVKSTLLTGSSITESRQLIELKEKAKVNSPVKLFYTIGVHPCCVNEFVEKPVEKEKTSGTIDTPSNDEEYNYKLYKSLDTDKMFAILKLKELYDLVSKQQNEDPDFRAFGEIGLDYDRFHYSCKELQLVFFEEQLKISCLLKDDTVPLFLHMRNCCDDFKNILQKFITGFEDTTDAFELRKLVKNEKPIHYKFNPKRRFVIHSFTDSVKDMESLLGLSENCYIGMNGASFRSEENIECVSKIPIDRLLLETDAPWCEIRKTHESYKYLDNYEPLPYTSVKKDKLNKLPEEEWINYMIKSRNEPCTMDQVATVVANVKKLQLSEVVNKVWETSCTVYGE